MSQMEPLHLQIPAHLAATLRAAVENGEYHSTNEAAYAALSQWDFRRKVMLEELTQRIREGEESPDAPPETVDDFLAAARAYHSKTAS